MSKYVVAGGTLNQTPLDWEGNVNRIVECITMARQSNVDILCLPELAITGYGCEDLFLSEWLPKKALTFLPRISQACENLIVAVGLPIRFEGNLYNCACLIRNQKILGFYAKQFLANDGVHYEPRWFTSWQSELVKHIDIDNQRFEIGDIIREIDDLKIGFEICEDAWRGDQRPACRLFDKKVNLILNPSASHFALGKGLFRENLVVNSSRNFNCSYIYANLLGNEAGRMVYDGDVLIAQKGRLIQRNNRLSFKDVNLVTATLDFEHPDNSSAAFNHDDHDRHDEFVKADTLALFDYLRKSKSKGFVLSLSGGADSSTCAILVAEMVRRGIRELGLYDFLKKLNFADSDFESAGKIAEEKELLRFVTGKILTCAYQATENSSGETFESARALANEIGAVFHHWNIDAEVDAYTKKIETAIGFQLQWDKHDIVLQNIQARTRAPGIWMLANLKNSLLITTSNRSEGDVGYATMDGDTCGSIAPIAAIDKHFINQWLLWAEKDLGYGSLSHVNSLNPTAELRPKDQHQTDEEDLMPYPILVEIEKLAIRDHCSPMEVFEQLSRAGLASPPTLKNYIVKFYQLWARNQWKRERIAPAFHLDDFNVDPRTWCRFPILSGGFQEELALLQEL
ncbi:nitrilase-related carbon-nitrogen hydrolase [Fulvivirgaceae bacterium BMA12]|uniref:Glutamine-dependent NAD(+) synthetase n=1 Tax=Agaribacillus aureus TaxID=3051825 RepID=A0ABT8L6E0_9BACT|nr:nitrilase-related carbon-nitrogen hydrolase [Fulvivirgaceae bacterium BMA12]